MKILEINSYKIEVESHPTEIFGLKEKPQMIGYDNDADWINFTKFCSAEVSKLNFDKVDEVCRDYMHASILEIGVARNGDGSFTSAILKNKPDSTKYLGIDLNDKSFLNNAEKNIYTLQENSFNQQSVRDYMKEIGIQKLSILFIDGWHSLNAVINDWLYADILDEKAIVILHDSNFHPGPTVFVEYIDEKLFKVEKYFTDNDDDYGLTIAYKL